MSALWDTLPIFGLRADDPRRVAWLGEARRFLEASGNLGYVAATSSGKTVVALLAALAAPQRVFFFVPTRILAYQHQRCLQALAGDFVPSRVITGETADRDRIWRGKDEKFLFCTPEVFLLQREKGKIGLDDFCLAILDEMHHAAGSYAYVSVVAVAQERNLRIWGLSASPAESVEKLKDLGQGCGISHWIMSHVKTPLKREYILRVPMDDTLRKMESIFREMLAQCAREMKECGVDVPVKDFLSAEELESVYARISGMPRDKHRFAALTSCARYRKIHFGMAALLTESYATFLAYAGRLAKGKSKADCVICNDSGFQRIVAAAKASPIHPKVQVTLQTLEAGKAIGETGIVFISCKDTGVHIVEEAGRRGIAAKTIFGGSDRNLKSQTLALKQLGDRSLDAVCATSVIREGISVPDVDVVIHHSMPQSGIAREQSNGRVGRTRSGQIYLVMLEHPLDEVPQWVSRHRLKSVRSVLAPPRPPQRFPDAPLRPRHLRPASVHFEDSLFDPVDFT